MDKFLLELVHKMSYFMSKREEIMKKHQDILNEWTLTDMLINMKMEKGEKVGYLIVKREELLDELKALKEESDLLLEEITNTGQQLQEFKEKLEEESKS